MTTKKRVCISLTEHEHAILRVLGGSSAISAFLEYCTNDVYYSSKYNVYTTLAILLYYKKDPKEWLYVDHISGVSNYVKDKLRYNLANLD